MALLTRDQIQNGANRLPHVDVECPELGGAVRIRTMRAREQERLALMMHKAKDVEDSPGFRSLLVAQCAIDENGEPLLTAEQAGNLNGFALQRVFEAALQLNRMGRFEEETLKNSEPAPNGESSSA